MLRALFASALITCTLTALAQKEPAMSHHAEGSFDVKTIPMSPDEVTTGIAIGRFSLDKQYHGALEATAKGEMLTSGSPTSGTAGYVAMEEVSGSLDGHR